MKSPTNRESDKFMLRLPDGMRDQIRDAAEKSGRSMNAEIVRRLQKTIDEDIRFEQEFQNVSIREISVEILKVLNEAKDFQEVLQRKFDAGQLRPSLDELQAYSKRQLEHGKALFPSEDQDGDFAADIKADKSKFAGTSKGE